jgi:PUA domain protein
VRDVKNLAPLAIGVALRSAAELGSKAPGKAIKAVHFVGDKLWKAGE